MGNSMLLITIGPDKGINLKIVDDLLCDDPEPEEDEHVFSVTM